MIMLQGKGRVTAQTLADRFEVSKRTIYRDLDELSAAGVPVRADRGVGGGIALAADFRSDLTGLTPQEVAAFALSGLPELASHLGVATAAASAHAKIIEALGGSAEALARRFHLDPSDWYDKVAMPPHLRSVARAVLEHRKICIDYESWSARREHILDPLGLVVKSGEWYLLGRSRGRTSIYRIAKITSAMITEDNFRLAGEFDLAAEWRSHIARFERRMFSTTAEIIVKPDALSRLSRLGAPVRSAVLRAPAAADGSRQAIVPIESIDVFARDLLCFGGGIDVVAPSALREHVCALIRALASQYEMPTSSNTSTRAATQLA